MKTRYFDIGEEDWGVVLVYDYDFTDFDRIWAIIRAAGLTDEKAQAAMSVLSRTDTGMTLTSFGDMMSFLFISQSSSDEEWFNTLIHELKHVVEHISEFYRVDPKSEPAAYLQGEIGRQMFPLVIQRMCDCQTKKPD